VTWLRWRLDQGGGVSMPASRVAKLKTVSQLTAVGMAIAPSPTSWDGIVLAVTVVAVVLTVYSGVEYFLTTRHQVATS
jgi:CDP-diacylglycerol---glycerol-3-phosphate 3-phosphatidyltransferase